MSEVNASVPEPQQVQEQDHIDTGSEFEDLYSHEEDNGQDDDEEQEQEQEVKQEQEADVGPEEDDNSVGVTLDAGETEVKAEEETKEEEEDVETKQESEEENTEIKQASEEEDEEEEGKSDSDSESEEDNNENDDEDEEDEEEDDEEESSKEDLKNVDFNLLEKQMKFLVDSEMLNSEDFKALSNDGKITAITNLINSNPETALSVGNKTAQVSNPAQTNTPSRYRQTLDYSNDNEPSSSIASTEPTQDKPPSKYERADLSMPMTLKERELYNEYLRGENKITEMHNIPQRSRLFIGNLPLKNASKEELFRIFVPYGHILQINIKNAFGFIQYDNPHSVLEAIKYESDEINFNKKLILEVSSSNSRPQFDHGDHGTNSSSTFISSSKRPFQGEDEEVETLKKAKRRIPNCIIYVKKTADRTFATEVFNSIKNGTGIETDMIFLKPRMELRKLINEAAYEGTWGVIVVNKSHNVDIQTFYEGSTGETKFDEYVNVSCPDAVGIFNNVKSQRMGGNDIRRAGNTMMPPAAGNMYGGYNQPPMAAGPNTGYGYGGANRYGNMPPQQPPMGQPQGYMGGYQGGNGYPPQQGYGAPPPPMNQGGYSRYSQPPQPPHAGMGMNQGYQPPVQVPTVSPPSQNIQPQLSAALGGNTGQMDQQQLLAAIQNLPPNVVSSLLSAAQQQQQPNAPQASAQQQQLVGMLQNTQNQQSGGYPPIGGNNPYAPPKPQGQAQSPPPHAPPPPQQQQQQSGSNVQSLLDSLAQLQK
ncbi:nuclear polyadenylated RNA-binding protein 3 [Monosporozyma servazzii]